MCVRKLQHLLTEFKTKLCLYYLLFSDSLQGYFSQFGEITDCIVMKNPQTGKSRGFGFVSFKDSATVEVILSSKSHVIDGRTVSYVRKTEHCAD